MRILNLRVDEYDMSQSLEQIEAFLNADEACFHQVVTINPEGLWLAQGDSELAKIIEQAALVTADGNGVLWAARKLGQPLPERVTGIELMERLCERAATQGWRVYLLGSAVGVSDAAAAELRLRYPGINIVGCENGFFREREQELIASVRAAQPQLLFAALGMPYQEKWLAQRGAELGCTVAVGVGGSFDVLAGTVKRAPKLWQKLKIEWLWRLLSQPSRWRRYLALPKFMLAVKREAREGKQSD